MWALIPLDFLLFIIRDRDTERATHSYLLIPLGLGCMTLFVGTHIPIDVDCLVDLLDGLTCRPQGHCIGFGFAKGLPASERML